MSTKVSPRMSPFRWALAAFVAAGVGWAPGTAAAPRVAPAAAPPSAKSAGTPAAPPSSAGGILPLAEVRPGMVGEAWTVFQGTQPEPFKVRVVSIMRKFLPRQDVILIRAEDPRVEFSGIVAGMSGSPVYIDGKLVGAVAYAWSFSKEPLGGVTPIESMLAERARPRRARGELSARTDADGLRVLTLAEGGPRDGGSVTTPGIASWSAAVELGGVPLPPTATTPPAQARLIRASVPLSVSGFAPRALDELARELAPLGLLPVQAGGGGTRTPPARSSRAPVVPPLQPGSAVGIELVRGDMSMVATGTVTYVDKDTVLAFGHPMFGSGELYLPMVASEIHAIVPSLAQSMKLSSPVREVGALVQDRQPGIVGELGTRVTMVPVRVQVQGPNAAPRVFQTEVARNRRLTPLLTATVASNALTDAEPDIADMVVTLTSKVTVKGRAPVQLREELYAPEGISRQGLGQTRGLRLVGELLTNPFEPVVLERVELDIDVQYRRDIAEIVAVALPGDEVRAGDTVSLRVTLRPYAGAEYVETIPVVIPAGTEGRAVRIEAASGGATRPEMPAPESLSTYLENLRRAYPPSMIVVSVQTPDEGAALRGRLLPDLPSVASDTLRPTHGSRRAESYRVTARTTFPARRLVFGKQDVTLVVRDNSLGAAR